MNVYFMRHGETNYNLLGLCNADPAVDVHLTTAGRRQAMQAAKIMMNVPLQHIFTSELPRTRQTADIINRFHLVPISAHPALNDIESGHEGRPVAEYFAAVGDDRLTRSVNGGESVLDYKVRVTPFLQSLPTYKFSHVLVVVHEETLRVINAWYLGLDDDAMMQRIFSNCEIIAFDINSGKELEIRN